MPEIIPVLLNDTLSLIQLARETALVQGKREQADRFTPVVADLRTLVASSREPKGSPPVSGLLAQEDFQTLLEATSSAPPRPAFSSAVADRNQMVAAMAAGGMSEIDIARQLGMTRDEVRLVLNINQSAKPGSEVSK